jgi:hypothetical protein
MDRIAASREGERQRHHDLVEHRLAGHLDHGQREVHADDRHVASTMDFEAPRFNARTFSARSSAVRAPVE